MWTSARATTALVLLVLVSGLAAPLLAQSAQPALPTLEAERRSGRIAIDGRIDEAAWEAASVATDFVQREPDAGQPSSERTEALVLFDDDALYVAFRNYVADPSTYLARVSRRDTYPESDRVSVDIDGRGDGRTGYYFAVTAGGTQQDGVL
ncbi:MAG: hypothetical protein AAFR95_18995, partial [Bacteroidota bacterium]